MEGGRDSMRVYIDAEGDPVQELSAICSKTNWDIYSVFHKYAACPTNVDWYSRYYVHGLRKSLLQRYGLPTERDLCREFCHWIDSLPSHYNYIFLANDPRKECHFLPMITIQDVNLPMWKERVTLASHQDALAAKQQCLSICGKKCCAAMHSSYSPTRRPECFPTPTLTQLAKLNHGYHCSLYDALECYFYDKYY